MSSNSYAAGMPMKRLANLTFDDHGGRNGQRSGIRTANKMMKKEASKMQSIRPGPMGMGMITPHKPTKIPTGHHSERDSSFSHFHQIGESYDEK
jgi:hypothetical protein